MTAAERVAELELDVDVRLADVWAAIMGLEPEMGALLDDDVRALFAAWLRVAYSSGYHHALMEAVDGRGAELYTAHGYHPPI